MPWASDWRSRSRKRAELGEFVALMESPSGRWLVGVGRSALLAAVDERAARLRRETISHNERSLQFKLDVKRRFV
jgi:hypothetical protein